MSKSVKSKSIKSKTVRNVPEENVIDITLRTQDYLPGIGMCATEFHF